MVLRTKIARIRATASGILLICGMSVAQAQTGNCIITGGTNNGTISQSCVIIGPVPPGLTVVESKPIQKLPDGTYNQTLIVELTGGYSPPRMILAMKGTNITSMDAGPQFSGVSMGSTGNHDDLYFATFQNPVPGRYGVTAITKDATPVTFLSQLN